MRGPNILRDFPPFTYHGSCDFSIQDVDQGFSLRFAIALQLVCPSSIAPYSRKMSSFKHAHPSKTLSDTTKTSLATDCAVSFILRSMNTCQHPPSLTVLTMKLQPSSFGALPPNACDSLDIWPEASLGLASGMDTLAICKKSRGAVTEVRLRGLVC